MSLSRLATRSAFARAVLVASLFGAAFGIAPALGGTLYISALPFVQYCKLQDSPGMATVYVFHAFTPGALSSRFRVSSSPGVTMTYVSEAVTMPAYSGTTQTGITI